MSREKQIEEMAKVMCGYYGTEKCYECRYCCDCHIKQEATRLYNAGYRKQSEVLDDLEDLLIDFDEMGFCPRTTVPDPEGYAVEWKRKLVNALQGYRQQSGEQRQIPCEIGSKIYEVTGEPGERIDIDEYTVSEVGLNGVFTSGGWPCYRPHRHYFAYSDEGVWWFFSKEDAEAERKRRDDP